MNKRTLLKKQLTKLEKRLQTLQLATLAKEDELHALVVETNDAVKDYRRIKEVLNAGT